MGWNTLQLALREIRRNLLRSFLTMLGIVIGVAAVITMVTLGNGATRAVSDQISSLGSNLLMVRPGQRIGPAALGSGAPPSKESDADALAAQLGGVRAVAPATSRSATVVWSGRNWSTIVTGTTAAYFTTNNWTLASGRIFTDAETLSGASVCVIGATVRRELFPNDEPLGAQLRVAQFSCQVVGLLASKGQAAMGQDQDDVVVMPLHTVQRRLTGNTNVTTLLVSLVGGIGIMNIMLVSVTERTREIGVQLAIGALEHEVLLQLLKRRWCSPASAA